MLDVYCVSTVAYIALIGILCITMSGWWFLALFIWHWHWQCERENCMLPKPTDPNNP